MKITTNPCQCCNDTINVLEINSDCLVHFNRESETMHLEFNDDELKDLSRSIKKRFAKKGFAKV